MSLTAGGLSAAIQAKINGMSASDRADQDRFWDEISDAIITYLTTNTQVNVTVNTTGTAAAQVGTGTGTIS